MLQALQLRLEQLAGTGVERLAAGKAVAHRMGHARHERQGPQGIDLDTAVVLAARPEAPQPGAPDAGPRKTGPGLSPFMQFGQGHQLAFGHAMQVDKLRQHAVNALRRQRVHRCLDTHDRLRRQ